MQSWDQRESIISFIGALVVAVILSAVISHLGMPTAMQLCAPGIAVLFYYFNMRRFLQRRRWIKDPFPVDWSQILERRVEYYRRLEPDEKKRFEKDVYIFLKEHRISGIGIEVDDTIRVLTAASAVMLIFGRPEWEYKNLPEILIYPATFDEEYSTESHPKKRSLSGILVPHNAIVLSKPELVLAFDHPEIAYHVGLHEFAHALDLADGYAEGIPADLHPARVPQWEQLMQAELRRVREKRSILNPYAGKNEAELFAVAVEYFFQRPHDLKERHGDLYRAMADFFHQDPASRPPIDREVTD